MDEPFGDYFNRMDFYKVLLGILEPTETLFLSTHLVEEMAPLPGPGHPPPPGKLGQRHHRRPGGGGHRPGDLLQGDLPVPGRPGGPPGPAWPRERFAMKGTFLAFLLCLALALGGAWGGSPHPGDPGPRGGRSPPCPRQGDPPPPRGWWPPSRPSTSRGETAPASGTAPCCGTSPSP